MKTYLGIALLIDVLALGVAVILGVDVGPLDELALVLAGGVGGVAIPRSA